MRYRKAFWWWTLIIWALGIGASSWAQLVEERILAQGEVRSYSTSYAYNNRVYVMTSSEVMLAIYDFGGAFPTLLGRLNYPGNTPRQGVGVLVDGNYAYVLYVATSGPSDNVRLAVVDVSNPSTPQIVGELAFPSTDPFYLNLAKSGNYLYLFPYEGNFAVVNVSNPTNPTQVRLVNGTTAGGVVVGNRLYTAEAANGVGMWDITQPDNPTRIGSVGAGTNIRRITAASGKLYALKTANPPLRLYIYDLSNPDSPTQVGTYDTERVAGLAAGGNFVFLSGYERGTEVVDVSTPSAPTSVRVLTYNDVRNTDPASGKVLIQGQSILALYDPTTQGTATQMYPYPIAVVQQGTTVFYAEEQRLTALDITNPSTPAMRGTALLPLQRSSGTDLALIGSGRVAVALNGTLHIYEQSGNSLNLLFQDDPGGVASPGFSDRIRLSNAALAMITRQSQIQIYDISNSASPQRAGTIMPATAKFDIENNTLYMATASTPSSLKVYDLTDPSNPVQLASVSLPQTQFIYDVAAGNGYVFTTDWNGNLALVDARVRTSPQVVGSYSLSGVSLVQLGYDPAVNVFYAYDGNNRKVFLFRVSDFPTLNPVSMTLSRRMYRLSFNGEQVLGAGREEGLVLYRNTLFGGPTLSVSGVTPSQGANQGSLRVAITGAGFEPGATVRLERGSVQVPATDVEFVSATRLNATFQFNGEPIGTQWDVVVRLPNALEARLANGFTIVEAVPSIAAVSPGGTRPVSTLTVTITGSLFVPGIQVTLLPPSGVSVDPINATSVEYLSQNQIRATFNLTPYQQIVSDSNTLTARLQVRNPNQQASNLVNWVLQFPAIGASPSVRSLELAPNAQSFTVEVEVSNALDGEPLRVEYRVYPRSGQERRIAASQVQSLGNRRWRLTFPSEGAIPSEFADTGTLSIHHMGRTASAPVTLYRPYVARAVYPVQQNNLTSPVRLLLQVTNDSPTTTVVLHQGERVIEPSRLSRTPDNWLVGVTQLDAQFPIRLEDLGDWTAEVRYSETQTARVANAVQITRGRPQINSLSLSSRLSWQESHLVTIQGSSFAPVMRVRAVITNEQSVVDTRVIEADEVQVNESGTEIKARFRFADHLRDNAYMRYEVYSSYTETAAVYDYRPIGVPKIELNLWSAPSFFRAGVGDTFTFSISAGALPEAPVLVFTVPVSEQDINSGLWDTEYRIEEYTSWANRRVISSGRRELTPENTLLIAQLSPIPPFAVRYVDVYVRFVARGRASTEPPVLRDSRSRVAPLVVAIGATTILAVGSYVLRAGCDFANSYNLQLTAAVAEALDEKGVSGAEAWANWLLDRDNVKRLMDLYTMDRKSIFEYMLTSISQEALSAGGDALKQAAKDVGQQLLRKKLNRYFPDVMLDPLADAFVRAYEGYKQASEASDPNNAATTYQDAVNELNGQLLRYAFNENVFEPPDGINLEDYLPNTYGIILNVGLSTFLNVAKDCLSLARAADRLFDRLEPPAPRRVRTSWDPNEKRGSVGIDGYVRTDSAIVYELLFENLATATAGAQEVLVEDTLPESLDESTLQFLSVQVGSQRLTLPENTTALNHTIDLSPQLPVVVRVTSDYDSATRKLRVRFSGIDPRTNNYYEEGFLPPNQTPPQGEGKVVFQIRPRNNVASGTVVNNQAVITFDPHLQANPPIVTNTHTLTLDGQPPQVTVEVPASAVPETKARLRWSATDDASGIESVEIWAHEGENVRRIGSTRAEGARTENGEVVIRARRFGEETRIFARSIDRVGNASSLQADPVATIRMGQPPQFSAGLHLIGIPLLPDANDPQTLFGFQNNQWATYNPVTGQYVQYPDAGTAPVPGRGIWVALPNAVQPNLVGTLPNPESHYLIDLQPGWNLIANPWTEPLVWHREAVQVRVQGVARPLSQATEFVEPYLWGWEPNPSNPMQGRYVLVSDAQLLSGMQTALQPWRGYWIYAHQACTLELPTPEEATLFTGLTRIYSTERNGGWSFRIGAQFGDQYDEVLLGVSGNERGLQVVAPPDPPTRSAYSGLRLRLTRDGTAMEADIQPRARRAPNWTLEVHAPPSSDERTRTLLITVPDLARLPRGVNPVLRDTQTGERRFLRNSAGWQIPVPAEGLTRTYEISLINTSRLVRIVGVQVQSNRSTHQHTVQFTLSDSARVSVTVQAGGQVVRTLEQGRSRSRGVQQVVWDGRDAQGRAMPQGNYQVVIQAETEDGQLVRAVAPITLTR